MKNMKEFKEGEVLNFWLPELALVNSRQERKGRVIRMSKNKKHVHLEDCEDGQKYIVSLEQIID